MSNKNLLKAVFSHRFSAILLAVLLWCGLSAITRIVLLIYSASSVDWSLLNILHIFFTGLFFDLSAASFALIPLALYLWLFPSRWYAAKFNHGLLLVYFFLFSFLLIFNAVSEWFFWEEFAVRYNFIAVDYLVYTTEVIGNIRQSYPINGILIALIFGSAILTYLIRKPIWQTAAQPIHFGKRSKIFLLYLLFPVLVYFGVDHKWKYQSNNQYVNELAGNGVYDFGFAFWHNELDYQTFYRTLPLAEATAIVQRNLDTQGTLQGKSAYTTRNIVGHGPEKRMNVVLISVESLSASFLGSFGNKEGLTPNLDSLASAGLLFNKLYATGTRTVRGLEALSLSIPPTPGQSIVKRPDNSSLFTIGSVFKAKGYQSHYIYGGYSYFDNMKSFFSQNGYEVTDRDALAGEEIHYANIWGVADEDLFTLSLRTLDQDYAQQKPFFAHIMTVSNHRPYTYPDGRIDIPSHTSREGAVKYTDYAIGKFIREAALKPWFSNTLFVIVADHCASSAGKVEVPIDKYHIPMIFYAPGHIAPGKFEKLTSQIDIAPSIFGYLNFDYESKFFGQDVFNMPEGAERAFISTYQSLGYLKNNKLIILDPNKKTNTFNADFINGNSTITAPDVNLTNEAIAYYQLAAYLYGEKLYGSVEQKK